MAQARDIRYNNKEFGDFRSQLIEFAKNYFPDSYNDFSTTSPGMMFIEMAAYVGDILSFYQDTQLQETFLQHVQTPSNLYNLAYMMGYRPKMGASSTVELTVSQTVDAVSGSNGYVPNWSQALIVDQGAIIGSTMQGNSSFITQQPVNFSYSSSYSPTQVYVSDYSENGTPTLFTLSKTVLAYSGVVKTASFSFSNAEKYKTCTIEDNNIIGILSAVDSSTETWYEVPFLGQDTVMNSSLNEGLDSNLTPYILSLTRVPKRFTTRFATPTTLNIQFGAGTLGDDDTSFLPNPGDLSSASVRDIAYDPSNFLYSNSYGLAPSNTTITFTYIVGEGVQSNVPSGVITKILSANTTPVLDEAHISSLQFINLLPATGAGDGDSLEEVRQNSMRSFSEQQRVVSLSDYNIRALAMPPIYGTVAKVHATQEYAYSSKEDVNPLAISLYVLSYDGNGKLTLAGDTLKKNLSTYLSQYKMETDGIDIRDAFIVNIGVQYEVVTLPGFSSRDVLVACTKALQDYFNTANLVINQPINLSSVYTVIDGVKGVQVLKSIKLINKTGTGYSNYGYDIQGATRNNIVYPSLDPCIFEVRYPEIDIQGRVVTL